MSGRKRILSLLLCAIMALSPFATIGASANGLVDTGTYANSSDTDVVWSGELLPNTPVVVNSSEQYYKFTPDETDLYVFNSYQGEQQTSDPYLYVWDSSWDIIGKDDDGADDNYNNFRVAYELQAGQTYYILFKHWGYASGNWYNAFVEKNPVASIEVADSNFEFILNQTGEWEYNYETDQEYFYYHVDRFIDEVVLRVNYLDGRPSEYIEYGEYNGFNCYTNQHENPWTVGGNNPITFEYMGKQCTVNATIIDNPVASIEFVSCDFQYVEEDGRYGWWESNGETEQRFFYYSPYVAAQNAKIKVNYLDGRPSKTVGYWGENEYGNFDYSSNQYQNPWTVGGNNTITLTYMGKECTFNVAVAPNPVESIEFVSCDFEYVENDENNGDWEEDNNGEEFFCYNDNRAAQETKIKVNYKDGRPSEVIGYYDENEYGNFDYSSNQYQNPWTIGGENTITITYMGKECIFSATVVKPIQPELIESIQFIPSGFEYIENYNRHGEWRYNEETEEDFFWYDADVVLNNSKIKVNFSDGTPSREIDYFDDEDSVEQSFDYSTDQWQTPWTVGGENIITITYMGKSCTYNAVVKPNPVESVEFVSCDFQYVENHPNYGYWEWYSEDQRFYYYYPEDALQKTRIKVNYNNGNPSEILECEDLDIEYYHNQRETPWTVGGTNNTITINYMGKPCEFKVAVVAGPFTGNSYDYDYTDDEEKTISVGYIGEDQEHAIVPANVGEYTVTGIVDNAYRNNTKLKTIYIPKTVTRIRYSAFKNCTGLVNVYYGGSKEEWNAIVIDSGNVQLKMAEKKFFSNEWGGCAHPSTYAELGAVASCGVAGYYNNRCSNCKTVISTTPIAATGAHNYVTTVTKGNFKNDGGKVTACTGCGHVVENTAYKKAVVKLSATTFEYNGKVRKPNVTVKTSNGKTISSKDYTVKFSNSKSKKYGTYKVTVTFKKNSKYSGKTTVTYSITSKKTSISSLKAGKKAFTVKYKKQTTATGYEVQYSLKKDFKGAKTVSVKGNKTVSKTVKKLNAKKTYYVRVRTVKGKVKSDWSATKKIKVK